MGVGGVAQDTGFAAQNFTRSYGKAKKKCFTPQSRQSAKLFLQSSELVLPQPLNRRRVSPPPPPVLVGGAHSFAREGLGESQFLRGDILWYSLYIYVLCALPSLRYVLYGFPVPLILIHHLPCLKMKYWRPRQKSVRWKKNPKLSLQGFVFVSADKKLEEAGCWWGSASYYSFLIVISIPIVNILTPATPSNI